MAALEYMRSVCVCVSVCLRASAIAAKSPGRDPKRTRARGAHTAESWKLFGNHISYCWLVGRLTWPAAPPARTGIYKIMYV